MQASDWSDVDASGRVVRMVIGLDRLRADPFFADQKARALDALALRGGERIVDIGCGTGEDTAVLGGAGCDAIGVERSSHLIAEARRRHPGPKFVAADARGLPFADAVLDRARVDRVLQHLTHGLDALREWRRVLRPDGVLVVFEPDLTTARIEGMDAEAAEQVLAWRTGTRPGATVVNQLAGALGAAGFSDVDMGPALLTLEDLQRADGMMGLPEWGASAAEAGALAARDGLRWKEDTLAASEQGSLRYSCTYLLASARAS